MLPNRIANDADEGSQRKILIDCVVQVEEHRDGCTGTTKSNALGPVICSTTWNSIVVAQAAVVRDPLRLAIMRSGDRCSAKQVHMTWTEDTTMNEDKQCLQRDFTEVDVSRRGAGRTCFVFV